MDKNEIYKLQLRRERGVLGGSRDNRWHCLSSKID